MSGVIGDLRIDLPDGFAPEEVMATYRLPLEQGYQDPRSGTPIRPNLVVHRRPDESGGDLPRVVANVQGDLATSVPGLSRVESADIAFSDGAAGVLLAYSMPAPRGLEIAQLQALRLDGDTVTSLTISTEREQLTDERRAAYIAALASARLSAGAAG
jgi:hypothetical protein